MASKKKRAPLSRERVLRAALTMADRAGVEALSMRKLASKLSVEAMSLYKHVANKDDVLVGIIDLVLAEIVVPPAETPWKHALRTVAVETRAMVQRHPWALPLLFDIKPTPTRLRFQDAVLTPLRSQGVSLELSYRAFLLMDSYVYGFVMQELSWRADDPTAVSEMQARAMVAAYPAFGEVIAHVTGLVATHGATAAYDVEFAFGLDTILEALERSAKRGPHD